MSNKRYPSFYNKDFFTPVEAICLISGDHPVEIAEHYGQPYFATQFSKFIEAEQLVMNAIATQHLTQNKIDANQFKAFLSANGYQIEDFHDHSELTALS